MGKKEQFLSEQKRDLIYIDPRLIDFQEGYNAEGRNEEDITELKASIKENGITTPLMVKRTEDKTRYICIRGHQRCLFGTFLSICVAFHTKDSQIHEPFLFFVK